MDTQSSQKRETHKFSRREFVAGAAAAAATVTIVEPTMVTGSSPTPK